MLLVTGGWVKRREEGVWEGGWGGGGGGGKCPTCRHVGTFPELPIDRPREIEKYCNFKIRGDFWKVPKLLAFSLWGGESPGKLKGRPPLCKIVGTSPPWRIDGKSEIKRICQVNYLLKTRSIPPPP